MHYKYFCPVCNQKTGFFKVMDADTKRKNFLKKRFTYFSCSQCSFWILKPDLKKTDLAKIYNKQYYPDLEQPHKNMLVDSLLKLQLFTPYESFIKKYGKKKLLDIGSGTGEFVRKMSLLGYDVYGLDPYKPAVVNTRKKIGEKRVFLGKIDKLLSIKQQFDTITMWHVLEHVDTPLTDLQIIHRKLKKGGRLFIEVPNADSILLSAFKENYNWHMIPEHNHYFTNMSLVKLLLNTKYKIIKQYCPPKALTNFSQSFKNWLIQKDINLSIVQILFLLSIPFSILETIIFSYSGKGEVIRVVAEKR